MHTQSFCVCFLQTFVCNINILQRFKQKAVFVRKKIWQVEIYRNTNNFQALIFYVGKLKKLIHCEKNRKYRNDKIIKRQNRDN